MFSCVVWCGVVWCGVVWCGVVWCGVVWCGVVWSGIRGHELLVELANFGDDIVDLVFAWQNGGSKVPSSTVRIVQLCEREHGIKS